MEEYITNCGIVPTITQGKFCHIVRGKHEASYGIKGAENIQANSIRIYASLMSQLMLCKNHNSLLVGKVQSGKTSNLELLTALAFDNGYNFLVILGGYDKDLVGQTTSRYGETFETKGSEDGLISDSPVMFTTNDVHDEAKSYFISDLNPEFVQECVENGRPIVVSCLKRIKAMQLVNKLMKRVCQEVTIKPFIIDDEGDQASLNTKKKSASPTYAEIQTMKKILGNPLYLSVTATPQANIFQSIFSDLIPASIHLIHPGSGYDGATVFHLAENHIIETICEDDAKDTCAGLLTKSLKDAINYFVVASALKVLSSSSPKGRFSDMIIHSAKEVVLHKKLFEVIYNHLDLMKQSFENKDDSYKTYLNELHFVYDKYVDDGIKSLYPFDSTVSSILSKVLKRTGAILHNGPGKKNKTASTNYVHRIYIGADLLQRGLTFKNLITTYFVRWASSGGNMDTNLQRARWFGYRENYISLCKMFTTPEISREYSNLADIEDDLWEQFTDVEDGKKAIQDIIISSEDTKQKPTAKNKAKYKEVRFQNRWVKQRFIVDDAETISNNNAKVYSIIEKTKWHPTTNGSRINEVTGRYAIMSGAHLISLIDSIAEAFDMEPFEKNAVKDLVGQDNIPVILMWKEGEPKRYRSLYRDQPNRIKALQQGADTTVEEKKTYEGDSKVVIDTERVNIQIYNISPGFTKDERTNQDQYMFAVYIPKGKTYFVKEYENG